MNIRINPMGVETSDVLEFAPNGSRQTAKYKGLTIDLYDNACYVRGSIHKYRNDGIHNADDFTLSSFVDTLLDLSKTLNIDVETANLSYVEFGVNVEVDFDIDNFINSIICIGNKAPIADSQGVEFKYTDYSIKIYKKINPTGKELLRYEIKAKTKKLRAIIKQDATYITTLADLMSSNIWKALARALLNIYDTMLFADAESIDVSYLRGDDATLFIKGCKAYYWSKKWNSRKVKSRELEKFKQLVKNNSTSTAIKDTRILIENKLIELRNIEVSPVYIPCFGYEIKEGEMSRFTNWWNIDETVKNVTFSQSVEKSEVEEMSRFTNLDNVGIRDNLTKNNNTCYVTELSLNIGIKQNDVLSAKGVEYYYQNERKIYDKILYPRLSEKMKSKRLKKQFEEIAHSLRNERSNPRNNLKRDLGNKVKEMSMLFDYSDMLRSDKKKIYKRELQIS